MRACLLFGAALLAACAAPEPRPEAVRRGVAVPATIAGAWARPGAGGAPSQWLVLDTDGSASLLGVDDLWGISWRIEGKALVLATQTPDNPAPRELRLGIAGSVRDRLTLRADRRAVHALAGAWQRRKGEILAIGGTIAVSEPVALPPDAVLRVALQPAAHGDGPPLTLAVRDLPLGHLRFPVRYLLHVPQALLERTQTYVVRARVAAAGEQRYVSADHVLAPAPGVSATVDVLLQPTRPLTRLRPPPPAPLAERIVQLEQAFAGAARERGAKAAFLEYLADDSIVLQPGPVYGRAAWEAGPDLPGVLAWLPDRAAGSVGGDLGIASGPWLYTPARGDARLEGRYLTVWRQTATGWRVLFDGGFGRPTVATRLPVVTPALDPGDCERGPSTEATALQALDLTLSGDAGGAYGARVQQRAGVNFAWFEEPQAAGVTGPAVGKQLRAQPAATALRPMGGAVASSGDLGFTYGLVEPAVGAKASSAYAHVWCRQQGDWKLLLALRRSLGRP